MSKKVRVTVGAILALTIIGIGAGIYIQHSRVEAQASPVTGYPHKLKAVTDVTGFSGAADPDAAKDFIQHYQLLQTITTMQKANIRFVPYGPGYLMASGKDANGDDKVVWLTGDLEKNVALVNQTRLKDGISEQQARALANQKSTVEQIFLAPMSSQPYYNADVLAWYVQYFNGKTDYIDFHTGPFIDLNQPPK